MNKSTESKFNFLKQAILNFISFAKDYYIEKKLDRDEAVDILSELRYRTIFSANEDDEITEKEKKLYDDGMAEIIKSIDDAIEFINTN